MAEWFYTITGQYAYQFSILAANELQFMVAALFFCIGFRRKNHFWLRLVAGLAMEFGLLWIGVVCRTTWEGLLPRIVVTLLQYSSKENLLSNLVTVLDGVVVSFISVIRSVAVPIQ